MISYEDQLLGSTAEGGDDVAFKDFARFFHKEHVRGRCLKFLHIHCSRSRRAANDAFALYDVSIFLVEHAIEPAQAIVVLLNNQVKVRSSFFEYLQPPISELDVPRRHVQAPNPMGCLWDMFFENSGIHTLTPSIEQVESIDCFTPLPNVCHAIRGFGYGQRGIKTRILGGEFEVLHQMLLLNNGRLIPSKSVSQAIFEMIELRSKSFDYSPRCLTVFEGGRLFEDAQRFCTQSRLPSKPHQTFWLDTYIKQVFEELIEGVIGVAHDEDRLIGRIVEDLGDQCTNKRLAGTCERSG